MPALRSASSWLALSLVFGSACGSRRIAGYLEELEDCPSSSSGSDTGSSSGGETETTGAEDQTSSASGDATSTGDATTSTGAETTTTGSTGTPPAECGNGVVEASGPVPEECDDGNQIADDGCDLACARDVKVFVSSIMYQPAKLKSLYIADALCANRADDAGLPDAITYKAWLSDSTTDARDRFERGRGRLVLVNGLVLAASWSALLASELQNPFEVTEKSETYHGGVWTGTRPDGTAVPGAQHCDDWSSDSFLKTGHYGYSDRATPEWTFSELDDNPSACTSFYAIYCLQSL